MTKFQRFCLLYAIFNLIILGSACTADWTVQAANIIGALVPAIQAALLILLAFGAGVSPDALAAVQKWGSEASDALLNVVKPLIEQYNAAVAEAKPGILAEIQTALNVVATKLGDVLTTVHITNPQTQAKVMAIFSAIQAQIVALVNLVPVLQGKVTDHSQAKAAVGAVKDAGHFKHDFNELAGEFGEQYKI